MKTVGTAGAWGSPSISVRQLAPRLGLTSPQRHSHRTGSSIRASALLAAGSSLPNEISDKGRVVASSLSACVDKKIPRDDVALVLHCVLRYLRTYHCTDKYQRRRAAAAVLHVWAYVWPWRGGDTTSRRRGGTEAERHELTWDSTMVERCRTRTDP